MAARGAADRTNGRSNWPLQMHFTALAVMVIAVIASAGAYGYVQSAADARMSATTNATFAAGKAAAQIASGLDLIRTVSTGSVDGRPVLAAAFSNPSACRLSFAPVGAFSAGRIDLVRPDGSVVCSSRSPAGVGAAYAGQSWLTTTAHEFMAPVVDPLTGEQVAVVTYPVGNLGLIAWFLDLRPVGPELIAQFGSGTDQLEFLVASADGKSIITRSIDSTRWTGARLAGTPFVGAPGTFERGDVTGTPRWYGQASVTEGGWTVYVGADRATALADAGRLQQRQLGIVAAGLLAVLLALALVYRQVVRPITQLSHSVRSSRGLRSPIPVPVGGPAEVAALGEDINTLMSAASSELKNREDAEGKYRLLFDHHPEPMWVYDFETLRFQEVNDAAIRRYGYSRDEFLRMTIKDIRPANDVAALDSTLASMDSLSRSGPWNHITKAGVLMEVEITSHVVAFNNRRARLVMAQDVTESRKLERQIQQAQRLESLGQLAGGVAHDFNNLLAVILNVTAMLKNQIEAAPRDGDRWAGAIRDLARVDKAAQSATRLTKQLLAFARREVVQSSAIDVSEQIGGLTELLRRTLGSHVVLTATLASDVWPVVMDAGHLEQVVINLAVNARDAMPKGGRLTVGTSNVVIDEAYAIGRPELWPGRYVRLMVSDSGVGMDKATLEHAFEPFFTTKAPGLGTGLGLATVYGIVQQVRGHISIYSEPGHGTTVTILIPATTEPLPLKPAPAYAPRARASGTVLVVEDYADLRDLIEEILKGAGYRVLAAKDGAVALDLARSHSGEIDVLLTDIVMPNMLGPDLAEQLKEESPGIRVLFMSGHAQPMLGAVSRIGPDVPLLQKPFMEQELLDKLDQVLAAASADRSVLVPQ